MDAVATGTLSDQLLTYAPNAANPNFGWVSAPNTPASTLWSAQTYTVKLNVTKPNSALAITQVKVYRVDASGGPTTTGLATVAILTGLNVSLGRAGIKQFVLNGSTQTANVTDRIAVKFYVRSSSASTQSFAYQAGSGTMSSFSAIPATSPLPSPPPTSTPDAYTQAVLADTPAQYFELGENAGPTAFDSSSTRMNGMYIGVVQFGLAGPLLSVASKAIALSGGTANSGVLLPNPAAPAGTSYSMELWAYPVLGTTYMAAWGFNSTHRLLVSSTGLLLTQFGGNFFSRRAIASQKWHHLVFTYDAAKQLGSYYIDGALDSSATASNSAAAFSAAYYLGQYDTGTSYKWNGRLARAAFYRKPLTAAQVSKHYIAAGYATPSPSPPPDAPCFGYRWSIKTGTDPNVAGVALDDKIATTIAAYTGTPMPAANNLTPRIAPVEDTVYQLTNVTMTLIQKEVDKDYHVLVADGQGHTVITESPDPSCAPGSRFASQIGAVRQRIDAAIPNVSTTATHPNLTVTIQGVGFFDYVPNFAAGEAPDGIEIHPITAICFGLNCKPAP